MDSELNLGITPEKHSSELCCVKPQDDPRPQYPEICFRGKHAEMFREKFGNCAPGDEYTMTLRCRVKSSSAGESEYENRIEMCAEAIIGDVVEEEADESGGEKKAVKPQRKLAKKEKVEAYA